MALHLPLQVGEQAGFDHSLEPFLSAFPANQIQKEDTDSGPDRRSKNIERQLVVIPRSQEHHKQIAADGEE